MCGWTRLLVMAGLVPVLGCSSTTPVGGRTDAGTPKLTAPAASSDAGACRMPVDPAGNASSCRRARGALDCPHGGCLGFSDDLVHIDGNAACSPDAGYACTSLCAPGEYASSCDGTELAPARDGGAPCRNVLITPGVGEAFYCCPCGAL